MQTPGYHSTLLDASFLIMAAVAAPLTLPFWTRFRDRRPATTRLLLTLVLAVVVATSVTWAFVLSMCVQASIDTMCGDSWWCHTYYESGYWLARYGLI